MSSPNTTTSTPVDPFSLLPPIPALDNTYGAMLLGTFGALILYGITLHQGYRYFTSPASSKDSRYIKWTVSILLVLETLHSVFAMHLCYYYLTTNYANPPALFRGVWSINILPFFTMIVTSISQSFFARRLWLMDRRFRGLVAIVGLLLVAEMGISIFTTVEAFIQPDLNHFENYSWSLTADVGCVIVADWILTGLLIYVLQRSKTGYDKTDSIINTLTTYAINTGLLTGVVTTVSVFMGIFYSRSLIESGINVFAAKLYANSMLAALNARQFLSSQWRDTRTPTLPTFQAADGKLVSPREVWGSSGGVTSGATIEIRVPKDTLDMNAEERGYGTGTAMSTDYELRKI